MAWFTEYTEVSLNYIVHYRIFPLTMSFFAIGQLSNIIFVSLLDSDLLRIVLINMINMINMKLNVFLINFVNIF